MQDVAVTEMAQVLEVIVPPQEDMEQTVGNSMQVVLEEMDLVVI
jgi:hypothetical protein